MTGLLRFPIENNSYFYPSTSLSFIFSEKLKAKFLNFGKLRLGWAKVGNDTDPYNLAKVYQPGDNFGKNPTFSIPNRLNNSSLKPEQTSNIELGLEAKLFNNRIGIDVALYNANTSNQIIPIGTTAATGYNEQFINAGLINNKGIEIQLTTTPIRRGDFTWTWGLNFAKNLNKIVELNADDPSLLNVPLADGGFSSSLNAYEGRSFGTIMGKDYLYDNNGNKLTDGHGFYLATPGYVPIADILPDFTGGIFTSLRYKSLSLSALVDYKIGGNIFSTTNMWGKYSGIFEETAEGDIREKGKIAVGKIAKLDAEGSPILNSDGKTYETTGEDEKTALPAQSYFFANGGYNIAAADVYDASFVKLKEVALSFTFPKSITNKLRMSELSLSIVGRNLAILYKNLPHLDPDFVQSTSNIQGIEGGQTPSTKSWGVNLNVKF